MRVRMIAATCAALAAVIAPGAAAWPAVASPPVARPTVPAHSYRITLVGIERNGQKTSVDAEIWGLDYPPIYTTGQPVQVPAGPTWFGATIETTSGDEILSTTLVLREATISRNATITLDARPGKRVTFALNAPGATDTQDTVQACVGGSFLGGAPVMEDGQAGSLYEVPVRSSDVAFDYASSWQDPAATFLMTGQHEGGLPARPHYAARVSSMARIQFTFRANTAVGGYQQVQLENSDSCAVQQFDNLSASNGGQLTQYVSAGTWQATAYGYRSFWQTTRRYAARHSYTDTFGAAVWGPGPTFPPSVSAGQLYFGPGNPIDDPLQVSSVCCDVSDITLSSRGHVIRHQDLSEWRGQPEFSASLPASAWYTFSLVSWRRVPGLRVPAGTLSPRVIVDWRFHAAPLPDSDPYSVLAPVSTAQFVASGLNLQNQAPSLGTTVLTMTLSWPTAGSFQVLHLHSLRALRLQVSFNGGKTWRAVSLVRHGRSWLVKVHDPASGYVSLRSTVIDSAGNSTVQTIYRAYEVG